jgi:hypothetical protein
MRLKVCLVALIGLCGFDYRAAVLCNVPLELLVDLLPQLY